MKKRILILLILLLIIILIITSALYNTLPRLQLNGSKNMTLSYRDKYDEPGVIVKNANGNYVNKIKIDNNIETNKIGNYYIDYSLKMGLRTLHVRRNIRIIDDISPIIKIKGEQIIELPINQEYIEPGYKAYDEYDGDLTEKVKIHNNIDKDNYGEYIVTYEVSDKSNNKTEINRIVKVIDQIKPEIECEKEITKFKIGTKHPIGCKAIDNYDGDITKKIQIEGQYDENIPGIYEILYKVEDDAGNMTKKTHRIEIQD